MWGVTLFLIRCNDNSLGQETRDSRSDLDVSDVLSVALMLAELDQIKWCWPSNRAKADFSVGARTAQDEGEPAKKSTETSMWEEVPRSVTWE